MDKKLFLLVITTLFVAILTSCDEDVFNQQEFTVSFDTGDNSIVVVSQKVKDGEKVTKPDNPARSGYTFDVWCREVGLTNEWKFDTDVVTSNITLHAKWNVNNGNGNGGDELCNLCGEEVCVCDEADIQLLEAIYYEGELIEEYEYDEKNRISKITYYSYSNESVHIRTRTYSYNNIGDLTSISLEYPSHPKDNKKTLYTKIGNKITWINDNANYTVDLNSKGLPEKQTIEYKRVEFNPSTGSTYSYFVREIRNYQYTNGNVSEYTFYMGTGSTSENISPGYIFSHTYTHDNMKSPFYHCRTPKWIMVFDGMSTRNNVLSDVYHLHDTNNSEIAIIYTYDDAGFPTKKTSTYKYYNQDDEDVTEVEYKYHIIER